MLEAVYCSGLDLNSRQFVQGGFTMAGDGNDKGNDKGNDNGTLHPLALPTHLTVRFAPRELPSGAVDLQDLSQFMTGLQRTLDAKVRYDFQVENIESERFQVYHFVIADVRPGSVECDLIFNLFSNNAVNISVPIAFGAGATASLTAAALFKAFGSGAASEAGKRVVAPVGKALEGMSEPLRRYLRDFLAFLRNITGLNPSPVSSELLDRAETGLKDMAQVGAKATYAPAGVTVSTGVGGEQPIAFDPATKGRLFDLLEGSVEGEQTVTARGKVTALDIDQNSFRLQDIDRGSRVRCRYTEDQQTIVLQVATPPKLVQADGVPHYRKGSDRTWPPLYLKVSNVIPMPTLWNMNADEKAQ